MIDVNKNNLAQSSSPYLRQHQDNPINWQEWKPEVLESARQNDKILFVSVGYATCHWCHVMASEAFSNNAIAEYLNQHFISIKIDREQRPDIDHYMMSYIQAAGGSGGWPLNVFLTPDVKPFFAATYIPVESRYGLLPFLQILQKIKAHFDSHRQEIIGYKPANRENLPNQDKTDAFTASLKALQSHPGPQFPAHSSLVFLLHYYSQQPNENLKNSLTRFLDKMAQSGLHDHLQGGFYRYCVDQSWTIPHFEKMIYDQAMHLWVFSLAYSVFEKETYKSIVEMIIQNLTETYENDSLYYSAHDADTDHREGLTYLWDMDELKKNLSPDEFEQLKNVYDLSIEYAGKIHLIKKFNQFLPEIETKLLQIRKKRQQPFIDKKLMTGWNALLGVAFIQAFRGIGKDGYKEQAMTIYRKLKEQHFHESKLVHSSFQDLPDETEFLEDHAAMLLLATYLQEEGFNLKEDIQNLMTSTRSFYANEWISAKAADFTQVPAGTFDHPIPSPVSLAEMAILRAKIILDLEYTNLHYKPGNAFDFYNLAASIALGDWHIIHASDHIDWKLLPLNSILIRSDDIQDCYQGACRKFNNTNDLIQHIDKT